MSLRKKILTVLTIIAIFLISKEAFSATSYEDAMSGANSTVKSTLDAAQQFDISKKFSLAFKPTYPMPNSQTEVEVKSYNFEVDRAYYQWTINGKIVSQGLGAKSISFFTGPAGAKTEINLLIKPPTGSAFEKIFKVSPGKVDMVWEAQTYVPPGFKGKALPTSDAYFKIIAVPFLYGSDGKPIPVSDLFYDWKIDYKKYQQGSGLGKNYLLIKAPKPYYDKNIQVTVSDFERTFSIDAATRLVTKEPKVLLYDYSATEGLYQNKAIPKEFKLTDGEFRVKAIPFFFSLDQISKLTYSWTVSGKKTDWPEQKSEAIFRTESSAEGSSSIEVRASNKENGAQTATYKMNLSY